MKPSELDRRTFIGTVAAAGATLVTPRANASPQSGPEIVQAKAPDGQVVRAGLVGCGGRGTGAMGNFLDSANNLKITALADVFQDRLDQTRQTLKKKYGQELPDSRCFIGFDAHKKLLECSDVDLMLNATPPHFRPEHFAAAVAARKHCFLEKPLGVDGPGVRSVLETAKKAQELGLCVMTGTQLRRDNSRIATRQRVVDGAIGDIVAARTFRNQGALWYRERQQGWSDMEYMIRDWVNWIWLSGDHIVEQHIHHLDQALWVMGTHPAKAVGMGGRARRMTGDQYDFFSIDYAYDNGVHMHSTIRQLNGCSNIQEEVLVGTKGICTMSGTITDLKGNVIWRYDGPKNNMIVQEHVDLVAAIRARKPINTVEDTAFSTLMAIMGRDSAYAGKEITWNDALRSTVRLGPTEYAMGPVSIKATVPVPGTGGAPSYSG
jgi:myo-inositol 2-dehydrogenase/D-chiro-inositol 1-dehydrogenase